jgi:hypothetical protein
MAWRYIIDRTAIDEATNELYVLASFFDADGKPTVREEFIMQIRPTAERLATRTVRRGNREIVEEYVETVPVDVKAEMHGNIARFAAMAEKRGLTGDLTESATVGKERLTTVARDPLGVRQAVVAEEGRSVEAADVPR